MARLEIDRLISIDNTGMPVAPNIKQLLDKDIKELYSRDNTPDKSMYIKEVGVIYYLADPKGPCIQEGLSRSEALKRAIEQFDLPVNYKPDLLVEKLIARYHDQRVGTAGIAVESLQKTIHNITLASNTLNEILTEKLNTGLEVEESAIIIDIMDKISKRIQDIPNLIKALNEAEQQLLYEEEVIKARGGNKILSSMTEEDV